MANIKKWLEQKRELGYALSGYQANENLLYVTKRLLRVLDSDMGLAINPPMDDIAKGGERIDAESCANRIVIRLADINYNMEEIRKYQARLNNVAGYFRKDKKFQIISSSFSRQIDEMSDYCHEMREKYGTDIITL